MEWLKKNKWYVLAALIVLAIIASGGDLSVPSMDIGNTNK